MSARHLKRVLEVIFFHARDEKIVRRAIKKHRGRVLRVESGNLRVSFPSSLAACLCKAQINHDILKGPPLTSVGGSGAPGSMVRYPDPADSHDSTTAHAASFLADRSQQRPKPEDFLLTRNADGDDLVNKLPAFVQEELASWLFDGTSLSENEKLILVGLLGELHFAFVRTALKVLEPFEHYREHELQDFLRERDRELMTALGHDPENPPARLRAKYWQVPKPTGAHELLAELEERGVHPREVIAAVAMGPMEVQRGAAEALTKGAAIAQSAIAKYHRAAAKLTRRLQTPLKQAPIISLVKLLLRHGYSERQAFSTTAKLLGALYPERFSELTPDQVRHRFKESRKTGDDSRDLPP